MAMQEASGQDLAQAQMIAALRAKRPWYVTWGITARRKPLGTVSLIIIVAFWVMAIFAPTIAPYPHDMFNAGPPFGSPSLKNWFGTDNVGRDVLSRVVYASRLSLTVSVFSVLTGTITGSIQGLISGYYAADRKLQWIDLVLQRITDTQQAFPQLILLLVVVSVLGTEIFYVFLALTILSIPGGGRVLRSVVISTRTNVYVEAAQAMGASEFRVMFLHVLPNAFAPVIILVSIGLGGNLLAQSSLSFLGLVSSVYPDWGGMLSMNARRYMERMWWLAVAPGAAISIAVLAYNMLGDALRDVLDPRLRGSR